MKPFQLILNYARRYKLSLIVTSLSMLALVGVQLLIPWLIKLLVANITGPDASLENMDYVGSLGLVALIAYVGKAGLTFIRSYMAHVAGWGVVADVRKYIYEHMQRLSLRFYEDKQVGTLMSNVVNDTDLFEQLISHAIPDVMVNVITLVGSECRIVQPELEVDPAQHHPHPAGHYLPADLCKIRPPGLPQPAKGTGRPERPAERQPFRYP